MSRPEPLVVRDAAAPLLTVKGLKIGSVSNTSNPLASFGTKASTIDNVIGRPLSADRVPRQETRLTSPAASRLVEIDGVSKTFATTAGPVQALADVSLGIAPNAFFTLLGPSGCGKTTLLRLIAGFEHADRGTLRLAGRDMSHDPPNRRPVNIVFQSYALFPHMSVGENVAFGLARQGLPRTQIAERVAAMLALVRLDGMAGRKPAQLSGGQQQRVALARALAPDPKVLLLDEPLSALDLKLRRAMQIELKRIQRETGITFLLVTHDQEEALSMSDRIAVMHEGRIEQIGAPREIHDAPCSRFVADFFGANVLPGALVGSAAAHVAVRPEGLEVTTDGAGLAGRVTEATYLGATTALAIALDCGTAVKVECHDAAGLVAGANVRCRVPPAAIVPLER